MLQKQKRLENDLFLAPIVVKILFIFSLKIKRLQRIASQDVTIVDVDAPIQKSQENLEAFVFKLEVNLSYSLISLMVEFPFSDFTVIIYTPEAAAICPTSTWFSPFPEPASIPIMLWMV